MRFGFLILVLSLSACSSKQITSLPASNTAKPDQSSPQASTQITENTDPYLLGISSEIKQVSQIKIANKLFILWLNHFLKADFFTRLDEYETVNIAISDEWQHCVSKLGADFIAEGIFSMKPTNGRQSWWWAGGGNSDDGMRITKLFVAAISKSDALYTLQILGVPPCF